MNGQPRKVFNFNRLFLRYIDFCKGKQVQFSEEEKQNFCVVLSTKQNFSSMFPDKKYLHCRREGEASFAELYEELKATRRSAEEGDNTLSVVVNNSCTILQMRIGEVNDESQTHGSRRKRLTTINILPTIHEATSPPRWSELSRGGTTSGLSR